MTIIVRIMGGLGNQMFQYSLARYMNITFGAKVFLDVDCNSMPFQKRDYELEKLNVSKFKRASIFRTAKYKTLRFLRDNNIRLSSFIVSKYCKEVEDFVYQKLDGYVYFDGYWQNTLYFEKIRSELLSDFSYDCFYNSDSNFIKDTIETSNSVGIHVRRGDYMSPENKNIFCLQSMNYYDRAIDYIINHIDEPAFFVFSDDIEWCKNNFSKSNKIVFVDCNNSAIEDFMLLKQCKHKIISNSTFSWWAAWLGKQDYSLNIAPRNWYKEERKNQNCINALLDGFVIL